MSDAHLTSCPFLLFLFLEPLAAFVLLGVSGSDGIIMSLGSTLGSGAGTARPNSAGVLVVMLSAAKELGG